jgi:S-adenosylmethionine hydrolase
MAQRAAPLIALVTDFGTAGWYVACLKAVILSISPGARLVDVTHDIPPQDVLAGAFTIAAAAPWFPSRTIFACVVDPGVGTNRPLVAAEADRRVFVGPDNGLLGLVFQRAKRLSLVRLANPRYWLPEVSYTFHGRDIIAPVAAHLANGCALQRLGIPWKRYHPLELPPLQRDNKALYGRILYIDAFGNLITNLPAGLLNACRLRHKGGSGRAGAAEPSACQVRYKRTRARLVSSYAEGSPGALLALAGSSGYLELALRNGSAARRYRARRGDRIEWRW